MERDCIKNTVPALGGLNSGSPISQSHAASFANILDIILSTQKGAFGWTTNHSLRLVCKATRSVVDSHVYRFGYVNSAGDVHPSICNLAPWPWLNLTNISMFGQYWSQEVLQRDVEYLSTIPLFKLEDLLLACTSVMPLVDCHFPMLTELHLTILRAESDLNLPVYPTNLKFPNWPLKELGIEFEADPFVCKTADPSISFLGPLLRGCVELTEFKLLSKTQRKEPLLAPNKRLI